MLSLLTALVLSQTQAVGSPLTQGFWQPPLQQLGGKGAHQSSNAYLIPESGTVKIHVNGAGLNAGTAKTGGAWTLHGTVPFNVNDIPIASVGPFTTSNYFSQTSASPANVGTPPFTVVMLLNATSLASGPVPFGTGAYNGHGYLFQIDAINFYGYLGIGPTLATSHPSAVAKNNLGVLMFGMDSLNNVYGQINGGTLGTTAAGLLVASSLPTTIGIDPQQADNPWTGVVYELMVSTAVPSAAAFSTIYNGVLANE